MSVSAQGGWRADTGGGWAEAVKARAGSAAAVASDAAHRDAWTQPRSIYMVY